MFKAPNLLDARPIGHGTIHINNYQYKPLTYTATGFLCSTLVHLSIHMDQSGTPSPIHDSPRGSCSENRQLAEHLNE